MKFSLIITAALMTVIGPPRMHGFQSRGMNASELRLELGKLSVLGSVLYVAAHPDDENTNLLSYLSKGRLVRAAYLSITRGEGGQNLIGREQGAAMGVIRTEELLAAREIDGAEQFFTRAIDFGYSKSPEEAIRFWGDEAIVSDIVRVMRTFRPDVVITRFSPTLGGHGQHTASAILARKAFELSGDSAYMPVASGGPAPWTPVRLLFNASTFLQAELDTVSAIKVNTGGYNSLLGESYNEISGRSRSMHKSQGFGASQNRGDVINYFFHTAGVPAPGDYAGGDILGGIGMGWERVPGGEGVGLTLAQARDRFDPKDPAAILPLLLRARDGLAALGDQPWAAVKQRDLTSIICAVAGLRAEAVASAESAAPGESLGVRTSIINRSDFPFVLKGISVTFATRDTLPGDTLANNRVYASDIPILIPAGEPPTTQYWLERPADGFRYDIADPALIGLARTPSPYRAKFTLATPGSELVLDVPIRFKAVDPVEGERYRPFVVGPPASLVPEETILLFPSTGPKTLHVRITGGRAGVAGALRVEAPAGWSVVPPEIPIRLTGSRAEERISFSVTPSADAADGQYAVVADFGDTRVRTGTSVISYPHIPAQTVFVPAAGRLVRTEIARKKFYVGYIEGSGDDVPDALRQIGYDVRLLTDEDLLSADLSPFQTIVAGVRAYNTRPALAMAQGRLMEYVSRGGAYVVQYATSGRLETADPGPYPFSISRERVSDETAPLTLLSDDHPALTFPNRIGPDDFTGWVQERGLYFAGSWDSAYVPLLSSNDPGEPPRRGGLLVARYGDGYYCYTGLSFFRQLPAGVSGAYRLFTNLVELGSLEKLRGNR